MPKARLSFAVAVALGFAAVAGCLGSEQVSGPGGQGGAGGTNGTGKGGSTATTGTGGIAATTGTGGAVVTTGTGGAPDTSCGLPTAAQTCAETLPRKPTVVDFSRYTTTGTWGDSAMGDLTGGTSMFQGAGVSELVHVVEGAAPDARLHVTGSIPVGSYAGFVLWFGPCVNASTIMDATTSAMTATTGIGAVLGGNLAGSQLRIQVQTHADYPVDAPNMKGACLFTDCGKKWSQCSGPTTLMTSIPATPTLTTFAWSRFMGGTPTATTTGDGVVGLQFQFECGTSPSCAVDVNLGTIILTTN